MGPVGSTHSRQPAQVPPHRPQKAGPLTSSSVGGPVQLLRGCRCQGQGVGVHGLRTSPAGPRRPRTGGLDLPALLLLNTQADLSPLG